MAAQSQEQARTGWCLEGRRTSQGALLPLTLVHSPTTGVPGSTKHPRTFAPASLRSEAVAAEMWMHMGEELVSMRLAVLTVSPGGAGGKRKR